MSQDTIQFIIQTGALGILAMFIRAMWFQIVKQAEDCKKEIRANRERIIDLHNRLAQIEAGRRVSPPSENDYEILKRSRSHLP